MLFLNTYKNELLKKIINKNRNKFIMLNEYNISLIQKEDFKYVIKLHLDICKESYQNILNNKILNYFQKKFVKERKKICYNKNNNDINLVVKHINTNKIVAFIDAGPIRKYQDLHFINNKNILEIKKFFLHSCCQGIGLSKKLFIDIIHRSLKKNPKYHMLIILSFKDNTKANRFYEKMGGKIYKVINYNINNIIYEVNCYKWIDIQKITRINQ